MRQTMRAEVFTNYGSFWGVPVSRITIYGVYILRTPILLEPPVNADFHIGATECSSLKKLSKAYHDRPSETSPVGRVLGTISCHKYDRPPPRVFAKVKVPQHRRIPPLWVPYKEASEYGPLYKTSHPWSSQENLKPTLPLRNFLYGP